MSALVETMAYAGETPWHGFGNRVMPNLSPEEIMKEAGVDWTVSKQPLYMNVNRSAGNKLANFDFRKTDMTALIRDTDQSILSFVPDDWHPLQNAEAFKFFKEFVDIGELEMNTAGSLMNGKRVWALAKTKESFALRFVGKKGLVREDEIENYLLFSNPHIYGQTITIDMTPTRVVCWNTLSLALSKASGSVVRVNHKNEFDPEAAKKTLFTAHENFMEYQERAKFLASKNFRKEAVQEYFNDLFPSFSKKVSADNDNASGNRNARLAMEAMDTQPGAKLGEGTWWQPFNAVTYLMDHKLGRSAEGRLNNIWFGSMKDKKIAALNKAIEYAEAA